MWGCSPQGRPSTALVAGMAPLPAPMPRVRQRRRPIRSRRYTLLEAGDRIAPIGSSALGALSGSPHVLRRRDIGSDPYLRDANESKRFVQPSGRSIRSARRHRDRSMFQQFADERSSMASTSEVRVHRKAIDVAYVAVERPADHAGEAIAIPRTKPLQSVLPDLPRILVERRDVVEAYEIRLDSICRTLDVDDRLGDTLSAEVDRADHADSIASRSGGRCRSAVRHALPGPLTLRELVEIDHDSDDEHQGVHQRSGGPADEEPKSYGAAEVPNDRPR